MRVTTGGEATYVSLLSLLSGYPDVTSLGLLKCNFTMCYAAALLVL